MTAVVIIVILILIWLIFGARIKAWLAGAINRFIARRTEDFIRRATGMPPRDKKESRTSSRSRREERSSGRSSSRRPRYSSSQGHIIPPEYAEDVEFVEIKEFSQTDIDARFHDGSRMEYHESQVSDVEWVEIKDKRK